VTDPDSISSLTILVTYACNYQARYQSFWSVVAQIKSGLGKSVKASQQSKPPNFVKNYKISFSDGVVNSSVLTLCLLKSIMGSNNTW
jgi:hypothetical protein